jgi:hypothetical protein
VKRRSLPFEPSIAKPCGESWAAMNGGSRQRHCQLCDKHVHNFAAMTPREIEKLVLNSEGKLCARITRRYDGSLVTLEAQPRVSIAAKVAVSASLALSAAAGAAQTASERPVPQEKSTSFIGTVDISTENSSLEPIHDEIRAQMDENPLEPVGNAILTGTVLTSDGSGPFHGAMVTLTSSDSKTVLVHVDEHGAFRAAVEPGTYDIRVIGHFSNPLQIPGAALHEGEQSLQTVRVPDLFEEVTVGGDIAIQWHFTLASVVRHPVVYLKYLARKL